MGTQCCVRGCNQKGGHIFPKDETLKKLWLERLSRKGFRCSRYSVVCHRHFVDEDFIEINAYGGRNARRRLKESAVPSVFIWKSCQEQSTTQQRQARAETTGTERTLDAQIQERLAGREGGTVGQDGAGTNPPAPLLPREGGRSQSKPDRNSPEPDWSCPEPDRSCAEPDRNCPEPDRDSLEPDRRCPEPPELDLPFGMLFSYVKEVRRRQQELLELAAGHRHLQHMVQFRKENCDWKQQEADGRLMELKAALPLPLLTVRNGVRDQGLTEDVDPLSEDLLRPLTPVQAWKALSQAKLELLRAECRVLTAKKMQLMDELHHQQVIHQKECSLKELRSTLNKLVLQLYSKVNVEKSVPGPEAEVGVAELKQELERERRKSRKLLKVFTPAQVRSLHTGRRPSWEEEDVRRALGVRRRVSKHTYSYLRKRAGLLMPSDRWLREAAPRYPALVALFKKVSVDNLRKMPYNRKYHSTTDPVPPYAIQADIAERKRLLEKNGLQERVIGMARRNIKPSNTTVESARERHPNPIVTSSKEPLGVFSSEPEESDASTADSEQMSDGHEDSCSSDSSSLKEQTSPRVTSQCYPAHGGVSLMGDSRAQVMSLQSGGRKSSSAKRKPRSPNITRFSEELHEFKRQNESLGSCSSESSEEECEGAPSGGAAASAVSCWSRGRSERVGAPTAPGEPNPPQPPLRRARESNAVDNAPEKRNTAVIAVRGVKRFTPRTVETEGSTSPRKVIFVHSTKLARPLQKLT